MIGDIRWDWVVFLLPQSVHRSSGEQGFGGNRQAEVHIEVVRICRKVKKIILVCVLGWGWGVFIVH